MWQETLTILLKPYQPAATLADSTHQFETSEIMGILQENGCHPTIEELTLRLKEIGFTQANTSTNELRLEWLMQLADNTVLSEADMS